MWNLFCNIAALSVSLFPRRCEYVSPRHLFLRDTSKSSFVIQDERQHQARKRESSVRRECDVTDAHFSTVPLTLPLRRASDGCADSKQA